MIANEETTANKERTAPGEMTVKHEMGASAETARHGAQPRAVGRAERAKVKAPQAGQRGRRAVKIQDVTFDEHPGVMFDVFLQTPEGRRQIGVMSFFGDQHQAEPQSFDFDATEALGLAPGEEPEIVFEPTTGLEAPAQGATALRAAPQADAQLNPDAGPRFGRMEIATE